MNIKNYAVDIRDVISLIRAHYEKDEARFKETSETIANALDKNGEGALSLFVKAQYGGTPAWVPMDDDAIEP